MRRSLPAVLVVLGLSCTGQVLTNPFSPGAVGGTGGSGGSGSGGSGGGATEVSGEPVIERSTTRRLSRVEISRTLTMVFGAGVPVNVNQLPEDVLTPFDNDVQEQATSMRLVEGIEVVGIDVAEWVGADASRLQAISPCVPSGAADAQCFGQLADSLARRLLRHPLDADDRTAVASLLSYATASGQFIDAAKMLIRFLVMHPDFLFRRESGRSDDPAQLTGLELATRMALLLEGRGPDSALLDAADAGELDTEAGRRAQAERLMKSAAGAEQLRRFVAMWLSYSHLVSPGLETQMRAESDALVDRAFAEGVDFHSLFSSDDTFVGPELATHYGLSPVPAQTAWVPYGAAQRRGILSHGSFSVAGAKFGDTSPTRRGKFIRERLLCQRIAFPTENVDVDQPPKSNDPNACKVDRYVEHRTNATCGSCHALMDPLGFGLENLDHLGRWRAHDENRPECTISGEGHLNDVTFTGPKQLADLVVDAPALGPCLANHFMRFAAGRREQGDDAASAVWLSAQMSKSGNSLRSMVLAYVAHPNFARRVVEN